MLTLERLDATLASMSRLTIGLVGDLFLDRYLEIEPGVDELSIETGLPAYQVSKVRNVPGALGTVMNNLASLGAGLLAPLTVIGDDGHGYDLLRELRKMPVDTSYIVADPLRITPTYAKPLKQDAQGSCRELNRLDIRTRGPLSEPVCQIVCDRLQKVFETSDGLIVLDQILEANWGVVNERVRSELDRLARQFPHKLIYIDSRAHLGQFSSGVLKGNRAELERAAGQAGDWQAGDWQAYDRDYRNAAAELCRRTGRPLFCTLGEAGILVTRPQRDAVLVPGIPVAGPLDIVGAGDSATAGIVAGILSGASETEAAAIGNLVASITVQQLGTTGCATPDQVIARWHEANS
jgi:bifunctional ADP-heptose synthase (sugar kinase/adenylyltransferase)